MTIVAILIGLTASAQIKVTTDVCLLSKTKLEWTFTDTLISRSDGIKWKVTKVEVDNMGEKETKDKLFYYWVVDNKTKFFQAVFSSNFNMWMIIAPDDAKGYFPVISYSNFNTKTTK